MHIAVRHSVCQQRNKAIFIAVYFLYFIKVHYEDKF